MLWIYLIVLQILFFIGLLYFLRSVLTRKISKATGDLEELSRDYVSKKDEAGQLIEKAQKEAKVVAAREKQAAEEAKEKIIKEAQDLRENILKETNKKGLEITEKAQRNAEFLRNELDQKIDERAKEKVLALIQQAVPQKFLQDVHKGLMGELGEGELDLKHLKLPEKIKEAKIVSAFSLTDNQKKDLEQKLKKKIGADVALKAETDPGLIAGFVARIGSVVIDASLKYKIQKAMQE
ncbi:MAG: F0F1 ATP synthase subunit delta [Candidatus Omnitrophica bacterium]|nr:F0F1 ATP synthase subunit delta [Candidatus Omnitrophota bacterium]